jgi:hypothetical protein
MSLSQRGDDMKMAIIVSLFLLPLVAQPQKKKAESFFDKLLRIAGISATPGSLRGDDKVSSGDVWIATITPKTVLRRLTRDGGYGSPIFDSQSQNIFALRGADLYRIPISGDPSSKLRTLPDVSKLVGASRDNPNDLLVVTEDAQHNSGAAMLSVSTGAMTRIPHNPQSSEDQAMLAHLRGWDRVYGDARLYCESDEKEGAGGSTIKFSDVYLSRGSDSPRNLTNGNGVSSSQPSLSPNGQSVVFIRSSR